MKEYLKNPIRFSILFYLIIIVVGVMTSVFFADVVTYNSYQLNRHNNAAYKNIVFSDHITADDGYGVVEDYYLTKGGYVVDSDTFMELDGVKYTADLFDEVSALEPYTCAMSLNLMKKNNLAVNDQLTLEKKDSKITITIVASLPLMRGFDAKYDREGVVIMGNIPQVARGTHRYITFDQTSTEFINADVISKADFTKEYVNQLILGIVVTLALFSVIIAMVEILFQRNKTQNYRLLKTLGMPNGKIKLTIFIELSMKYFLVMFTIGLIVSIVEMCQYGAWGMIWLLVLASVSSLNIVVFAIVNIRRVLHGKRNKDKQS